MTDAQTLLAKFIADWQGGRRPDVGAILGHATPDQREGLAEAIESFLTNAPVPLYDEQVLLELEGSQAVREAERSLDGRSGAWPLLLPALRRQRRLKRADVARRLATDLGFPDARERVREHLHDMEIGAADSRHVSHEALVALARVLGTSAAALRRAGDVLTFGGPPLEIEPSRRGFSDRPPFSEIPSGYRRLDTSAQPAWEEVDRLFRTVDD